MISRKQYSYMIDLMARWVACPQDKCQEAELVEYQDRIGWPWKATPEQVDDWNMRYLMSWDSHLAHCKAIGGAA